MNNELKMITTLNQRLKGHGFCLPIASLLIQKDIEAYCDIKNDEDLIKQITIKTMLPYSRIMQIISRYEHLKPFQKTNHFIVSALRSYYFEEYESAQIMLLLSLESILQQWLSKENNKFNKQYDWNIFTLKKNITEILKNTPTHHIRNLLNNYKEICNQYIDIFFKDTREQTVIAGFNRHQTAHFLHDVPISQENIARACLFLDIISELIYCQENKYNNISRFTYFDSVIEKHPPDINKERLQNYVNLEADFMSCVQADIMRKNCIETNKKWLRSIKLHETV